MTRTAPSLMLAFLKRDWLTARSYRMALAVQLLGSVFIIIILYEAGQFVNRIPHRTNSELAQGYFPYVLVGIAIIQIVHSAIASFAAQLREEQTTGTLEALLATPVSPSAVILGSSLYDLLRPLFFALWMIIVGVALGMHLALTPQSVATTLAALAGLMALFAGTGVAVAAFVVIYKRGASLVTLTTGALSLLGGVYFPVSQLPEPIRTVGELLPFTWGVSLLRNSLLFGKVDNPRLLALIASAAVMLGASLLLFRLAVNTARRSGSLAQY